MIRHCVVAVLLFASGSSVEAQAQAPLTGTVLWRGRPAEAAVLEFIPSSQNAMSVSDTVLIDQRHLRFAPRVVGAAAGTTVEFQNSDEIMHNVFSPERRGANFDLGTYPQGESRTHTFDEPGSFVILCHVHPEMAAWIVVSESPWVAATDESGVFTISSLPPGGYELVGWYRRRVVHRARIDITEGQSTLTVEMGS